MAGGDDQAGPGNLAVFVHLVVVIERAARSFDLARAFQAVDARSGANMLVENERISENLFDFLDAVECLNQPRVVIVEGAFDRPTGQLLELGQLFVRLRCSHGFDYVEPRQRTDAITALRIAERLVIDELGVAVVLDSLANHFSKAAGANPVFDNRALRIDEPQCAVCELDGLVLVDQAHVIGRKVGEDLDLRLKCAGDLLVDGQRQLEVGVGLGQHGQNLITMCGGERFGDAAGNHPSGMDALGPEQLDNVLAEAAQSYAGQAQIGAGGRYSEDVARFGVGLHA